MKEEIIEFFLQCLSLMHVDKQKMQQHIQAHLIIPEAMLVDAVNAKKLN